MTEEQLDAATMEAAYMLVNVGHGNLARVVQKLWDDRREFRDDLLEIANWDLQHSEALTVDRAVRVARRATSGLT